LYRVYIGFNDSRTLSIEPIGDPTEDESRTRTFSLSLPRLWDNNFGSYEKQ